AILLGVLLVLSVAVARSQYGAPPPSAPTKALPALTITAPNVVPVLARNTHQDATPVVTVLLSSPPPPPQGPNHNWSTRVNNVTVSPKTKPLVHQGQVGGMFPVTIRFTLPQNAASLAGPPGKIRPQDGPGDFTIVDGSTNMTSGPVTLLTTTIDACD